MWLFEMWLFEARKRKRDISIQKQNFGNRFFRPRLFKMITQICSFRFGGVAHNYKVGNVSCVYTVKQLH